MVNRRTDLRTSRRGVVASGRSISSSMSCTTILYPRCLCPIQWLNPSFRDTRLLQSALCVFGCKRWKPCWFLILACNLGNNSPSMPRTIENVGRQLVISFPLWCNDHTRQPSFSSARLGTIVVTEWLGKCLIRIVTFDYSGCRVSTVFFVARSTHWLPGILMPRTAHFERTRLFPCS